MKLCPEQNLVEMSWIVWGNIIEKQTTSVCVYTSRSDWSHIWEILEKLVALAGKRTQASPGAGDNSTTEPPALMLVEEENMWWWNSARSWNLAATDEDVTRTFHLPPSRPSLFLFLLVLLLPYHLLLLLLCLLVLLLLLPYFLFTSFFIIFIISWQTEHLVVVNVNFFWLSLTIDCWTFSMFALQQ